MADEDSPTGGVGRWVKNIQLLITILTAAFSLYISVQQHTIKEQLDDLTVEQQQIKTQQDALALVVSRKAETEKFVERALAYVEKLSIPEAKQREAIVINLLDAIALATVSIEGTTDLQKILHTPLWIALATGNVEALGLIGKADPRREAWLMLAHGSGDATVRRTAMEALARASASRPLEALLEVYALSEELNNADTLDHAIQQIGRIVRVMGRHPDPARFREDDRITKVIVRLDALRTSLAAGAATLGGDETGVGERRVALQRQAQGVEHALTFLRGSEVVVAAREPPTPGASPAPPAPIKSLIEGLKSANTDIRRQSRQALADITNPTARDQLLDELVADQTNYRVRLGVASALYQSKPPIVLTNPTHVQALVGLIGDEDVLIRKYASEALMKLTDPGTVRLVHGELLSILQHRASVPPNAVYNAVVVLGTWLRVLPLPLQAERASITPELQALKEQLQRDPQWSKTSALIDEMLRLSNALRQTAAHAMTAPKPALEAPEDGG